MKKTLVSLLPLFFVFSCAFAENIIPSKISEVTVFTNKAQIMRRANIKVRKGINNVSLEVKAFRVDKDSVTAKIFGEGEILSVQLKTIYLKEQPQENINELKQKIDGLNAKRRKLTDKENVLAKKGEFLNSVINFSHTQVPRDIKTSFPRVEDLKGMLSFLDDVYRDINERKEVLYKQIKEIDKELEAAKKELISLRGPARKEKKIIDISFNSKKAQSIKVEASYVVYGASWHPIYKAEMSDNSNTVDLVMFSDIRQKTGEDWNNVKLNVSNAVPLSGIRLPSVRSWFLNIARLHMEDKKAESKSIVGGILRKGWRNKGVEIYEGLPTASGMKEAVFASAKARKLPLSFEYNIPEKVSITSRKKETLLPVLSKQLKGEFYYYAVPKINSLVFLVCRARADSELMSGNLNVYFEGTYIGKTFLNEKKTKEEFVVNLGAARDIKVEEKKIKDKLKETFFGKLERQTIVRDLIFKVTVENLKDKPAIIHIVDNIPVSKTDKIKVKDIHLDPSPAQKNYQDKEGVMLWKLKLAPKENREIEIGYTITYPKDIPIVGFN